MNNETYVNAFFQEKEWAFGKFINVSLSPVDLKVGDDWMIRFAIYQKQNPTEKSTHYWKYTNIYKKDDLEF